MTFYADVQGGDCLRVLKQGGEISLERNDGGIQAFHLSDGEICFANTPSPGWVDNVVRHIGFEASRVRESGEASLVARGTDEPLSLQPPDVDLERAIVHSGRRTLVAAWRGGEAPFSVEIWRDGGKPVVQEADIGSRLLIVDSQPQYLTPGQWRVRIRDARNAIVERRFTVLDQPSADSKTAAQAVALAGHLIAANPQQAYDAALTLAPFAQSSESAAELLDAILVDRPHD